ncbi:hypothetical protein BDW74DRAFT_157241, partial [Aspergillus multicolor]|uniref:CFEM domain-containing protein n=1 Tax=Aspergillus multicolor TaxID=41759 RepID=UPI003CCDA046
MKLYIAVTLLFGTSLILAQGLPNVPTCSLQCFLSAMSSDGCTSLTDFACHCRQPALVEQVTPCVEQACSEPDQSSVSNVVMTACSSAGVPISIPPVGAATTTTAGDDPTTTGGDDETAAPPDATASSASPSGPLMTSPSTTPTSSPGTPGVSSQVIPSDPVATSSQFLGGAESFRAGGKLAGAAAAIAAGYL